MLALEARARADRLEFSHLEERARERTVLEAQQEAIQELEARLA
jgi:hypothetical protein